LSLKPAQRGVFLFVCGAMRFASKFGQIEARMSSAEHLNVRREIYDHPYFGNFLAEALLSNCSGRFLKAV
jgi:hypothetical protein